MALVGLGGAAYANYTPPKVGDGQKGQSVLSYSEAAKPWSKRKKSALRYFGEIPDSSPRYATSKPLEEGVTIVADTDRTLQGEEFRALKLRRKRKARVGQWRYQSSQEVQGNFRRRSDALEGRVKVPEEKLKKHRRGEPLSDASSVISKKRRRKVLREEERVEWATEQTARAELLLTEEAGLLVADPGEETCEISQREIAESVDILSATKHFDLDLYRFGPYRMDYSRDGRFLLLGGRKAHVAAIDWMTKKLLCEVNVMESVHDVKWLHNENMFAVAQKEWVYIYDSQGIELHCLKQLDRVQRLEFLPYHFLLASGSSTGFLSWLDVSVGKIIASFPVKGRENIDVMTSNPANAVLCTGCANGTVAMWTPNIRKPVAKMLCHISAVRSVAVDTRGHLMATAGVDRHLKIWDIRNFKPLESYTLRLTASELAFSQRGLLAAAMGNVVEVYRGLGSSRTETESFSKTSAYMSHRTQNPITDLGFCPFEDVLGIGTGGGFSSLLIPGAGEPNFDAMEANPFRSKSQRREAEVKALLDKIQPELISLDPGSLGEVDEETLEEKLEAKKQILFVKPKKVDFTPRHRTRHKLGSAKQTKVKQAVQEQEKRKTIKLRKALEEEVKEADLKVEEEPWNPLQRFTKKRVK